MVGWCYQRRHRYSAIGCSLVGIVVDDVGVRREAFYDRYVAAKDRSQAIADIGGNVAGPGLTVPRW